MKLYSENKDYKLYQGNMLDMLEIIEPNSIDSIITDPPYGLTSITKRFGKEDSAECKYGKDGSFQRLSKGFMGKEWDGSGIEYNVEAWTKCYEVLKPGGYLLAFGGSRTYYRIACAIEDAGFEIRDTIMWLYGAGFPKSLNIGKSLEKKFGDENNGKDIRKQELQDRKILCKYNLRPLWETNIQKSKSSKNKQEKVLQSELSEQILYRTMQGEEPKESVEDGKEPSLEGWSNLQTTKRQLQRCKICSLSKKIYSDGEERWICNGTQIGNGKSFKEMFDKSGSCTSFRPQSKQQQNREFNVVQKQQRTQISREEIEYWKQYGTSLKPAYEPIIVARKPFKTSVAENIMKYGVGGLNIDECRVGNEIIKGGTMPDFRDIGEKSKKTIGIDKLSFGQVKNAKRKPLEEHTGRFPANIILTYDDTDFDEVCGGFPNTKSCKTNSKLLDIRGNNYNNLHKNLDINYERGFNDSESASRYFYNAKASKKDRDEGLDMFEEKQCGSLQGGNREGEIIDDVSSRFRTTKRNIHPTVKPTTLMQYLVRLVSPKGATILDCFNGSGSTGKAVMYENRERNANYKYIGIEMTEEYLPISKARIEYICNMKDEEIKEKQLSMFDEAENEDMNN